METENKGATNTTAAPLNNKERKKNIMTNQEILELLAEHEEILFYALCDDRDNEALRTAHESARQSLESFAHATGCHN